MVRPEVVVCRFEQSYKQQCALFEWFALRRPHRFEIGVNIVTTAPKLHLFLAWVVEQIRDILFLLLLVVDFCDVLSLGNILKAVTF